MAQQNASSQSKVMLITGASRGIGAALVEGFRARGCRVIANSRTIEPSDSRYTHRVAISNRRLVVADQRHVTFTYKDYRIEGPGRYKTMTLGTHEFIRRFLSHVLPRGFHRIRHYGLLASGTRADNLATMRALLAMAAPASKDNGAGKAATPAMDVPLCPCCGGRMLIIERFEGRCRRRKTPPAPMGFDTS
jgi:NAD(P)-dependent dehydrogenase (short-subunit alcohol dehydrogenase family)